MARVETLSVKYTCDACRKEVVPYAADRNGGEDHPVVGLPEGWASLTRDSTERHARSNVCLRRIAATLAPFYYAYSVHDYRPKPPETP